MVIRPPWRKRLAWYLGLLRGRSCGLRMERSGRPGVEQTVEVREPAGLCAIGHAQLLIDVGKVELDRLLCHPELGGHAAVRCSARDETQDLELAGRQQVGSATGVPRGGVRRREGVEQVAGQD